MRRKSPSPGGLRDMPCSGPATPAAHANYLACYRNEGRISRSLPVTRSVPPTLPHVWIGTSGWHYDSWRGPFFSEELRAKEHLRFYAEHFPTTELNGVFYRTPTEEAVRAWRDGTPEHFLFAWKASKFITHW